MQLQSFSHKSFLSCLIRKFGGVQKGRFFFEVWRTLKEVEKIWKNGGSKFFPQSTNVTINLFLDTLSTSWLHIWISQIIYHLKSRLCLKQISYIPLVFRLLLFFFLWSFLSTSFDLCLRYLFIIICGMFIKFFNAHTLSHAITKQGTLARKVGFNTWKSDEETEAFVNFKDFSQFWKMGKCRD